MCHRWWPREWRKPWRHLNRRMIRMVVVPVVAFTRQQSSRFQAPGQDLDHHEVEQSKGIRKKWVNLHEVRCETPRAWANSARCSRMVRRRSMQQLDSDHVKLTNASDENRTLTRLMLPVRRLDVPECHDVLFSATHFFHLFGRKFKDHWFDLL